MHSSSGRFDGGKLDVLFRSKRNRNKTYLREQRPARIGSCSAKRDNSLVRWQRSSSKQLYDVRPYHASFIRARVAWSHENRSTRHRKTIGAFIRRRLWELYNDGAYRPAGGVENDDIVFLQINAARVYCDERYDLETSGYCENSFPCVLLGLTRNFTFRI